MTSDQVLSSDHYFNSRANLRKGTGVEPVIFADDIYESYAQMKEYYSDEIESELKMQLWEMIDFHVIDPDGYYIRITTRRV
ncbi:hypothetical protein [Cytobacillus purgationiresistens]|uniref:Lactoylglutathione lyase n=1 Tax=Cytobacillus purgationiresistens TaxID=863449 RepID=A0ABU0AAQ6_9BACI|nr:hypothetical protein [Cytobacillus purgationiresistens]MDQ0268334.1 hypothetical protein [Cytobacillus purgationiresistens]